MAEQKEEKEDRRKRAHETIAFLLQRVEEVCGQAKRVDSVADQIEEIAGRIRDFAEATETKELLPERIQGQLRDAWQRFEQAKENNDALVDACKRVKKALKLADGALAGGGPPGIVVAAAVAGGVAGGAAAGGLAALILVLAGVIPPEDDPVVTPTPTSAVASVTPTSTVTPRVATDTPTPTDTPTVPRPANDDFANAEPIGELAFSDSAETAFATLEEGEPQPSCITDAEIDRTLWYSFTPATSIVRIADTLESNFDTVLAIYVGGALEGLEEVDCDDGTADVMQSRLRLVASANETYYFQVGGLAGDSGTLVFNLKPEPGPD